MNDLFLRAPCMGGRGFDPAGDLTLSEKRWWTRASDAVFTRNTCEALLLVRESRAGRKIRGIFMDPELSLLDQEILREMEKFEYTPASAFSKYRLIPNKRYLLWEPVLDDKWTSAKLVLDSSEREKLKSAMQMEQLLLRSCGDYTQKKNVKKPCIELEEKRTFLKKRIEDKVSQNSISLYKEATSKSSISLHGETGSCAGNSDTDVSKISIALQDTTSKSSISLQEETGSYAGEIDNVAAKIRIEHDIARNMSQTEKIVFSTAIDDEASHDIIDLKRETVSCAGNIDNVSLNSIALKELAHENDASKISIDTEVNMKTKKIGFFKKATTFFTRVRRCLGGCFCGGRRED